MTVHFTGPLVVDGSTISSTELGYLDGLTPGTAVASKALVLNSSKGISTITSATITTLTSTTGNITTVAATTGNITTTNSTTLNAGADAVAGTIQVFPTTTAKGKVTITASDATGNTTTNINIAAQAGAVTYTVPDAGVSTSFMMLAGTSTMAASSKIVTDKTTGTCTSNAVTIDKQSGVITTEALTTAAGASQAITLTNAKIATSSVILCQIQGGTNTRPDLQLIAVPGSGSAVITIYNTGPADAINGTVIFSFLVV